ncbi:g4358 [Coccomyxa viridis]|uniref:G4358 protein n=1 Tax=Coccomyxa viridis TaxID=1274662 RepID=A0ABP1FSD8_9CHLO
MAYIRSLAASASGSDPENLTWKEVALVMKHGHLDLSVLGQLDLDGASAMAAVNMAKHDLAFSSMLASKATERALDIADLLLEADCTCCTEERMKLAARTYYILMGAAFFAGNIMEACRAKWLVDCLEAKPPPWLFDIDVKPPEKTRQGFNTLKIQDIMGSMHDVLNAFRSPKALVGIPEKWSGVLRASPKALCWYPAHISSQDTYLPGTVFQKEAESNFFNCGSYKMRPVFVARHRQGQGYSYTVHSCGLQGDDTKMEVDWLTVLWPRADRFEVGAVSGSMLYLTTFCPPISGAILGIDLTRPDEEPKARWTMPHSSPTVERGGLTMVALGGDLYVYGGCKETSACPPGSRQFLSDIIVARARNGVVSQPWKQLAIKESVGPPPRLIEPCFFGHESPEGQLRLYLFSGVQLPASNMSGPGAGKPVSTLWRLDLADAEWIELEQHGSRPCMRMMSHGAFMSPDGQKALIAGGTTAFSCKHFSLAERSPRDARVIALPDLFELDLSTACWVPIVPKGKKWISGFRFCGGAYLASNHIGLLGLSRDAEVTVIRLGEPNNPVADWATAVNIRHGKGQGAGKDSSSQNKAALYPDPGSYLEMLLQMDRSQHACTILTQHFSTTLTMPCIVFTPRHKEVFGWSEPFGSMLKGKYEVIPKSGESLKKFPFKEPWLHPELCPFNVGPHWLGGYDEVSIGVKRVEPPSHAEQAGVPWFQSMHNVLRAFQTTKAAEEYFNLMLPPWDANEGCNGWVPAMEWARDGMPAQINKIAISAYTPGFESTVNRPEFFPVYVMAVSGSLFVAMLLDMRGPNAAFSPADPDPDRLWPYEIHNFRAISQFLMHPIASYAEAGCLSYQCAFCGEPWNSTVDSDKPKPKVCECQMVRYCTRTCQSRHWRVHKPICKAARQPGGITQDQALSFVHN